VNKRKTLIANLSEDLAPARPATGINRRALAWFLAGVVFVVGATFLAGPVRPGAFQQLLTEPRFLLETLLGLASIAWLSLAAFRSAIPAALSRRFLAGGFILMALWLLQYVAGLVSPALEPTQAGKRPFCYLETFFYGLPIVLAGLYFVRRLYPLNVLLTALAVGLVGGMLPALYMQLACMYDPTHILVFHILPGLLAASAALIAAQFLRNRKDLQ
jgi:hypothetical protein